MNKLLMYLRRQSLQKKWMLTSSSVIFLSYTIICVVVYISLHTWLLNDEESKVERTSRDIISFLQSQGPDITIQQIQQNTGLLKSIVDRDETVRMFNADGVDILRINNTSAAAPLNSMQEIFETTIDKQDVLVMNEPIRLGFFKGMSKLSIRSTVFNRLCIIY